MKRCTATGEDVGGVRRSAIPERLIGFGCSVYAGAHNNKTKNKGTGGLKEAPNRKTHRLRQIFIGAFQRNLSSIGREASAAQAPNGRHQVNFLSPLDATVKSFH